MIEIKNLLKKFDGVHAVDGLSLAIEAGTVTSIIGPNGSGKTTLTNLLSGILSVDSGAMFIDGEKMHKLQPYQIHIFGVTRTFQEVRLFEQMTVLNNILVVLTERNVLSSLFEQHNHYHLKKAQAFLTRVGLWGKKNDLAKNLSYGQRKLLEIARVMAMDAKIILLDEPFAGMFPEMIKIVCEVILELKGAGKTIILIEHNMDLIRRLSDHLFVLDGGKLLAQGKPAEVLALPEVIEAYLGK